jgi:predicted exporter
MSSTPVLHMIGITVAIGATVALVVSMALAPERPRSSINA